MDENTKKQIEHLSKVFGTDKLVSTTDIAMVLKGLKSILDTYKEETVALNNETADYIKNAIGTIQSKYDELLEVADEVIETKKNTLTEQVIDVKSELSNEIEQINSQFDEVKGLLSEIKKIKVKPAKDGKTPVKGVDYFDGVSVNKDEVVSEILSTIKLPEYEIFNLEEKGEQIVNEINALPLEEEYKIDASHIKNLPKITKGFGGRSSVYTDNTTITGDGTLSNPLIAIGGGSSLTVQDIDGNPTATNVNTIKFTNGSVTDDGAGVVTVTTGSGGGGDVSSSVGVSVDSEIALFDGTGGKTIKRATGTGVAHLTSGVLSASNVVTADITDANVTLAKMADVATGTVFYRKTAGTGVPEVQTLATLKTDLGLSGTNTGDQTSIVGITGTKAEFDSAVSDGNILYVGDITQYTDEMAQDAVGNLVGTGLSYNDGTGVISSTITQYTDELAQDAVGGMVANSTFVNLAYVDGTPSLTASLSATGTPSTSTFLRGDNTWATPAGSGDVSKVGTPVNNQIGVWTGDGTIEGDASLTFDTATDLLSTVNATLTGELTLPNTGLHILDTNGTHDLIVAPGSNLTADRTLTVTTGDTNMILDLTAVTDEYVLAYDAGTNTWRGVVASGGGGGGGITRSINNISGTTSAGSTASTDYVYNATSGTFTITLPTAVGNTNLYIIKNSGTGIVTVATTSSQTIDGVTTQVIPTQYSSISMVSDGANWILLDN